MKERWIEVVDDAEQKLEAQFNIWSTANNAKFATPEAEEAYRRTAKMIKDAIQMEKTPERIPVWPSPGFYPVEYSGISMYDAMYNVDALSKAWIKFVEDFAPDATSGPGSLVSGKTLDILDLKIYHWPGHGVSKESEYQYVEKEYMSDKEYVDLIDDPTGYFLYTYLPRVMGKLEGLKKMPTFLGVSEIPQYPVLARAFDAPELQETLKILQESGSVANQWASALTGTTEKVKDLGVPLLGAGFTKAPLDVIGDCLRGTKGVLMDMFRKPDELKEACLRLTPGMIKSGVNSCKAAGNVLCFIPLHKGADGFMSEQQYADFYWPTLRKLAIGLINEGVIPLLFAEGGYNQRLDVICDLPKGKVLWLFDNTDMARAKETVGKVSCIAGNVPSDILCTGTPDDLKDYCKNLIDVAGKDGGFILSTGAGMQGSKKENVKAMIDFSKEYGQYR